MRLIALGRELGRTVPELLASMTPTELTEQLAYSSLMDSDWRKTLEREVELERQRAMPLKERVALQKGAFSRK